MFALHMQDTSLMADCRKEELWKCSGPLDDSPCAHQCLTVFCFSDSSSIH